MVPAGSTYRKNPMKPSVFVDGEFREAGIQKAGRITPVVYRPEQCSFIVEWQLNDRGDTNRYPKKNDR